MALDVPVRMPYGKLIFKLELTPQEALDQSWKRVERAHKLFNHAEQLKAIRQHLDILETICRAAGTREVCGNEP